VTPRKTLWTIVAALVCVCAGCTAPAGSAVDRWISAQGGTVEGPGTARLRAVTQPLVDRYTAGHGSLFVLDSDVPGAFAWPDGRIFVSSGLLSLLDDQELTAAVAHELGHLLADRRIDPPVSIRGRPHDNALDEECRADTVGVSLLHEIRGNPASMPRMLDHLCTCTRTPANCRQSLRTRVARLAG
jgi:hypothetical protein